MNTSSPTWEHLASLSDDELLTAALEASRRDCSDEALACWMQFLARHPNAAEVHYLVGAERAQRGEHSEAVVHFARALEANPALTACRFQLGLLWTTLGVPTQALHVLRPTADLDRGDPYRYFGGALIALCTGELAAAEQSIERGLLCSHDNAALNSDMMRLLDALRASGGVERCAQEPDVRLGLAMTAYSGRPH